MARRWLIGAVALVGAAACDDQAGPGAGGASAPTSAVASGAQASKGPANGVALPKSTRLLPIPEQGPLGAWDGDTDELEIYSAVITAVDCAKRLAETEDQTVLATCGPIDAARSGFAIFDPAEGEIYLLDPKGFHQYELEAGFQGSMDITGKVVGTRHDLPVLSPEDFTITNKPPAGAFKGCL